MSKNLDVNQIYFWKTNFRLDNEIFRNLMCKQHFFFQSIQVTYKHKHWAFHEFSYLPTSTSAPIDQTDLNKSIKVQPQQPVLLMASLPAYYNLTFNKSFILTSYGLKIYNFSKTELKNKLYE